MNTPLSCCDQQSLDNNHERPLSAGTTYGLARACMPHCIAVVRERFGDTTYDTKQLYNFVEAYGSHNLGEGEENEYYVQGRGWKTPALAGDLRSGGYEVVVQNLLVSPEDTNIANAVASGRIQSEAERDTLLAMAQFGGDDRDRWLDAIAATLTGKGLVIATIGVPKLDGSGTGGHGVVVYGMDDGKVNYFDPDKNYAARYIDNGLIVPDIVKIDPEHLYYSQPAREFASRMTGEVMCIRRDRSL